MTTIEILKHINPTGLDYQDWLSVGMALHYENAPVSVWDEWSQQDADRYHPGECAKKWKTFRGSGEPITVATLIEMARKQGWQPSRPVADRVLDWDDPISQDDDYRIVDSNWLESVDVKPIDDNPAKQLSTYLEALFGPEEFVGYVTETWEKDGRSLPTQGSYDRTAGQLLKEIKRYKGKLQNVLGDCNEKIGAWIRFNPLDGQGVRDANVTDFRYALVESDSMPIEQQRAIYEQLELPIAAMVYSGSKSLHAIVRINAPDINEYRKRVDFLYEVCKRNGLEVDRQNRNPSRLSRLPGVKRDGVVQDLVAVNVGKASWDEWRDWIEDVNDELPDPEPLTDFFDKLPPLANPLIEGILRQGHKLLLTGPSKAGKSYWLIELCIAIAEGKQWLGRKCAKGRVLYVNLELDRASCLHRFKNIYEAHGWAPKNISNVDIWNLRGNAIPMDRLAPKLIRRSAKRGYIAVVIDPIYKVITGDENAADKMAHFCNQFDKVCHELGAAVFYCHHHSKGYQGGKRSSDRASGSGVFARDPDAILDLIELVVSDNLRKEQENVGVCDLVADYLTRTIGDWEDHLDCDEDKLSETKMRALASRLMGQRYSTDLLPLVYSRRQEVAGKTAWRVEGTLREFARFEPINFWFDYPIHRIDTLDVLKDASPEGAEPAWNRGSRNNQANKQARRKTKQSETASAFAFLADARGEVSIKEMAKYCDVTPKTIRNRIEEIGGYAVCNGMVSKTDREEKD